jgi:hypothetical protein
MRITRKAGLVLATLVAALGAFAPTASAADTDWQVVAVDPAKICREVQVGGTWQTVCAAYGTNKQIGTGATVAPYASVTCAGAFNCYGIGASVGTTGFMANPAYPLPTVLPGGGFYHPGGTAGTAYANGASVAVNTPNVCFGTPAQCPGGGILILSP